MPPYKPAGHREHDTVPVPVAYVPNGHSVHVPAPAELLYPAAQGPQAVLPPADAVPALQV